MNLGGLRIFTDHPIQVDHQSVQNFGILGIAGLEGLSGRQHFAKGLLEGSDDLLIQSLPAMPQRPVRSDWIRIGLGAGELLEGIHSMLVMLSMLIHYFRAQF